MRWEWRVRNWCVHTRNRIEFQWRYGKRWRVAYSTYPSDPLAVAVSYWPAHQHQVTFVCFRHCWAWRYAEGYER